jgi:NAD(P)-dependent dehydrogenase (short-subunit alcohol dehydrogenase family)
MLVNNAGIGAIKPLLDTDVNKLDELIELNITALTRLTYAAAPAFVARGTGTIINISSVVGIAPEFLNGVYGASKSFVTAFSQSLQHELAPKGLRSGKSGRCRACRPGPGRNRHNPRSSGWCGLGPLRGGASRHASAARRRHTVATLSAGRSQSCLTLNRCWAQPPTPISFTPPKTQCKGDF